MKKMIIVGVLGLMVCLAHAQTFDEWFKLEAPIKLTTSGRGKLTTCFAGEDLVVQVCQG